MQDFVAVFVQLLALEDAVVVVAGDVLELAKGLAKIFAQEHVQVRVQGPVKELARKLVKILVKHVR